MTWKNYMRQPGKVSARSGKIYNTIVLSSVVINFFGPPKILGFFKKKLYIFFFDFCLLLNRQTIAGHTKFSADNFLFYDPLSLPRNASRFYLNSFSFVFDKRKLQIHQNRYKKSVY